MFIEYELFALYFVFDELNNLLKANTAYISDLYHYEEWTEIKKFSSIEDIQNIIDE